MGKGRALYSKINILGWYSTAPGQSPASVRLAAQLLEENNLEVGVVRGHSLCVLCPCLRDIRPFRPKFE